MKEKLRTVRFYPFAKDKGPSFFLTIFDCFEQKGGKYRVAYELRAKEHGKTTTIFNGEDFFCSPMYAIDSDDAVKSIMTFLTLRPGDTDKEYFSNYTAEQSAYCTHYAEALSLEVLNRFGE